MKKNERESYLLTCTKLKSEWIKDLNMKLYALNLIEKKVGNTLEHIGIRHKFLNKTPKTQTLRSTIDKWNLMKLKSFFKAKDTVNRTNQQPTD